MFDHVGVVFPDLKREDHTQADARRGRYYCAYLIDFDGNNIEAGVYV